MPEQPSDADLFEQFCKQTEARALEERHLLVIWGSGRAYTIRWGSAADGGSYEFDPARARGEGIDALVNEAIAQIHTWWRARQGKQ